jgi:hypothetical protein
VPELLRVQREDPTDADTHYLRAEGGTRAVSGKRSLRPRTPTSKGTSAAPRRIRLTDDAHARRRHLPAFLLEPPT